MDVYTEERARIDEQAREARFLVALAASLPEPSAAFVQCVWDRLKANVPGIVRVPFLDLREEGGVLLTWDQGAHHLDAEVVPEANLDFFYLNRDTNEAWDIEASAEGRLPEKVLPCLNYFRVLS